MQSYCISLDKKLKILLFDDMINIIVTIQPDDTYSWEEESLVC
jgi:hypothetical protein